MTTRLSAIRSFAPDLVTGAELIIDTQGEGFTEIHVETTRTPASMLVGFEPVQYVLLRKDAELPEKVPQL